MLTSKQRSYLRGLSNTLNAIFHVGKEGITDNFVMQVRDALEARELVKINVLENSPLDAREACTEICDRIGSDPVQVIGKRFTIYKASSEKPFIVLPIARK